MPIVFAFISFFGWGIGSFAETVVARRLQPYSFALWGFILSSLALSFYAPFVIKNLNGLTFDLLIFIAITGILGLFLGTIVFYEALRIGNRALVGTIAQSFPAVTVLVSTLFLGERVSVQQAIAIVVIFTGLMLSSLSLRAIRTKNIFSDKGVLLAFVPMICWGVWFALLKIPIGRIGWFWPNYLTLLLFPLLFLYTKIRKIPIQKPTINRAFIPLIAFIVFIRIAELSYNFAISKGLVTIVAPIAGANPILFIILAFIFFKDKITKQQIAGIIVTLFGIVLLSLLST
ncbi:MAG: DMT family transporter [Patescibacteria group bacterium]|nr:DMT family transporter [Patescibacteria group bacterium]